MTTDQYIIYLLSLRSKIPEYMIGDNYTLTLTSKEMIVLSKIVSMEVDNTDTSSLTARIRERIDECVKIREESKS